MRQTLQFFNSNFGPPPFFLLALQTSFSLPSHFLLPCSLPCLFARHCRPPGLFLCYWPGYLSVRVFDCYHSLAAANIAQPATSDWRRTTSATAKLQNYKVNHWPLNHCAIFREVNGGLLFLTKCSVLLCVALSSSH